jgi:hypothetical protein
VLALRAVPGALPPNCRVRTFGAPAQLLRGLQYGAVLVPELRRRPLAVLAHMSPVYARLAAPLARPLRVPVILWYTQWRTNPLLERTVRVVDLVLTADVGSFPFASAKVRPIGHGIDVDRFACADPRGGGRLRLLALGRYAEAKDYATVLRALRDVDAELELHGSLETDDDRLNRLARADALVSATRGGADKAVYEAASACVPVFAAAPAFDELLPPELRFAGDAELADRLRAFAALPLDARAGLGRTLRARVVAEHSVGHWADAVLESL